MQTAAPTRTPEGMWTTPSFTGAERERERLPPRLWASVWSVLERSVDAATADARNAREMQMASHPHDCCVLVLR